MHRYRIKVSNTWKQSWLCKSVIVSFIIYLSVFIPSECRKTSYSSGSGVYLQSGSPNITVGQASGKVANEYYLGFDFEGKQGVLTSRRHCICNQVGQAVLELLIKALFCLFWSITQKLLGLLHFNAIFEFLRQLTLRYMHYFLKRKYQ